MSIWMKRILRMLIIPIMASLLIMPACSSSAPEEEATVVVRTNTFGQEYWPGGTADYTSMSVIGSVYESLLLLTPENEFTPNLAESWERSSDSQTYTFHLRKGVQFHDGWGEMTAEDVKFSHELVIAADSLNAQASYFKNTIASVEIVDNYTIKFHMTGPDWMLPSRVSYDRFFPIVSKKYFDQVGIQAAGQKPIGTGPYRFAEHKQGELIRLEAVEDHWRVKQPNVQTFVIKLVTDDATAIAMMKAGEIDQMHIELTYLQEAQAIPNVVINSVARTSAFISLLGQYKSDKAGYDPNCPWASRLDEPKDSAWNQRALKVRKALDLAIDKKAIIDTILMGYGLLSPITNFYPWEAGWDDKWTPYPDYKTESDPELAKQLLAEAGYGPGDIKVEMVLTPDRNPIVMDIGEAVGQYWSLIGIDVSYKTLNYGAIREVAIAREGSGIAWVTPANPGPAEPISQMILYLGNARLGWGFEDDEFQALMDKAVNEVDAAKRDQIQREMGQWIYDTRKLPQVCIFGETQLLGPRIKEWPLHPVATVASEYFEFVKLK